MSIFCILLDFLQWFHHILSIPCLFFSIYKRFSPSLLYIQQAVQVTWICLCSRFTFYCYTYNTCTSVVALHVNNSVCLNTLLENVEHYEATEKLIL